MPYLPGKFPRSRTTQDIACCLGNGAEILAYLKWLINSAAFKDSTAEPRGLGSIHGNFYRGWRSTFRASEDLIRRKLKKQLECWYAKHPPSNLKRHSYPKDDDSYAGASDREHEQLLKIYHDDDARPPVNAARPPAGLGGGGVGH